LNARRFALAGFAFTDYTPQRLASFVREMEADGLDYWPWNRGDMTTSDFATLMRRNQIEIIAVNIPSSVARVGDPDATEATLGSFVQAMEDALVLGAPSIQVYSSVPDAPDTTAAVRKLLDSIEPILVEADARDLTVLLENNLDQRGEDTRGLNPARSPDALQAAFRACPASFRLCFDPANFVATGQDPALAYEQLWPFVANVHVKDCRVFDRTADATLPEAGKLLVDTLAGEFLPTVVGRGEVPWPQLVASLRRKGYDGWYTLDPFIVENRLESWCHESLESWRSLESDVSRG
jgi:sugar phosphate isomerase/epimerase